MEPLEWLRMEKKLKLYLFVTKFTLPYLPTNDENPMDYGRVTRKRSRYFLSNFPLTFPREFNRFKTRSEPSKNRWLS